MQVVADLHLHSRFSRAVSKSMTIPVMSEWGRKKGIELLGTGDFTHPVWIRELKRNLKEYAQGVYKLSQYQSVRGRRTTAVDSRQKAVSFILSTELSCIYKQGEKTRRIHIVVLAPNFEAVEKISKELTVRGANILSDGRPILGLTARQVIEIVLEADEKCLIIPAHIWTPWFSMYGAMSGFDSIEECFGEYSKYIYAIETGLSSDPAMNWRIEELDSRQIVSFGDAHSPGKLGREATVFELKKISYKEIYKAITRSSVVGDQLSDSQKSEIRKPNTESRISHTIEFYPEEGKYHYTGHRKCKVVYSPNEARKKGLQCPVCGRPLTVGVMSRVESLARSDVEVETKADELGVKWIYDKDRKRKPYAMLVPLAEIIAEAKGVGVGTKTVNTEYEGLISMFGSEFDILLKTSLEDLDKWGDKRVVEGIEKVRSGDIHIEPGHDGVFGKVKIWREDEGEREAPQTDQTTLF